MCSLLWACSGSTKESPLVAQSDRINADLAKLSEESPMFIDSASCTYADGALKVNIGLHDPFLPVKLIGEPFAQFAVAHYLKVYAGPQDLEVVNELVKENGNLVLSITSDGGKVDFTINAHRLMKLYKSSYTELNFSEARLNMMDIMASHAPIYTASEQDNLDGCEFTVANGFAQYTMTFKSANTFKNLTQAQLTGRYVKVIKEHYEQFGECEDFIISLIKCYGIDGYRFIYIDKNKTKELKAGIPWRLID